MKFFFLSGLSSCGFRNKAQRAGVKVKALTAEIRMEIASVRPNWRKKIPAVPWIKDTGMNTAAMTKVMDTMAPAISLIASIAAVLAER